MAERSKYWVGIQLLNFYSYLHWESCMQSHLRKHGLWEIVNGIEAVQPEDGGELRRWKAKAQKALAVIKANIQQDLWKDIQNAQTPNEAWDILTQKFSRNLGTTSYLHGRAMGEKLFNLNEPPIEDAFSRHVMLVKDGKPVCRTQCLNPPPKVCGSWSIFEIKPVTRYSLSDLPLCSLHPAFENSQQRREWGAFLVFLQNNNRVAAGNCGTHDFYILPPPPSADYSHVQVRYCAKDLYHQENDQGISSSVKKFYAKRLEYSCKSEFSRAKLPHVDHNLSHEYVQSPISSLDANVQGRDSYQRGLDYQVGQILLDDNLCCTDHNPHQHREDIPCPLFQEKDDYLQKNFIRVDPSYLRTLSQAHSGWIFGAIAELVDNSRDAKASRLDITVTELYSKKHGRKIPVLSVIDDGHGMSHLDIVRMLSFGHKQPEVNDPDLIGRFGVGFKTGAMRLGQDAVILTQTSCSRSVALLSQSFNEGKDNLEIPIVSYHRQGSFMEVDKSFSSEASANAHLQAIKDFSPFNEYFVGEKFGLFGERDTGTQIYIWNLDKWGSDYSLKWETVKTEQSSSNQRQGDILIRSRRIRSRPGQISQQVPLDYSLQSYLEVIFLEPRMKIFVQGSLVKGRPLAKTLSKTVVVSGDIMGMPVQLTLGLSQKEWDRVNCGMFLYWHGRLIEAYKRVGGMVHSADMGRGVIGVIDVTNIMNDRSGHVWVHNNKQGFQDCELYAKLEEWLGNRSDEYWDTYFEVLHLRKGNASYKPDHEWVQCDKCRKWRKLSRSFNTDRLPAKWFCHMPPFDGKCYYPEEQAGHGVITVGAKQSGCDSGQKAEQVLEKQDVNPNMMDGDDSGEESTQTEENADFCPVLKRLRRGLPRHRKKG